MVIKRYPDGRVLMGFAGSNAHQSNEHGVEDLPAGTVQVSVPDNTTTINGYAIVAAPTGVTFTAESSGINSGFNMDDLFTVRADMYMKDNIIKFKLYSQVYSFSTATLSESVIGYVFPVGSTSDLTGFDRVTSISVKTDYEDGGGSIFNIVDPKGTATAYCRVDSSLRISIVANQALVSAGNVLLEVQSVTNKLLETIDDVSDTVADLSSESAAKFVSR